MLQCTRHMKTASALPKLKFRKFRSDVKWKCISWYFGFFRPEYWGSPLEVVHFFWSDRSVRKLPFHFGVFTVLWPVGLVEARPHVINTMIWALCPFFWIFRRESFGARKKILAEARGSRLGLGNSKIVKRLVQQVQCFRVFLVVFDTYSVQWKQLS